MQQPSKPIGSHFFVPLSSAERLPAVDTLIRDWIEYRHVTLLVHWCGFCSIMHIIDNPYINKNIMCNVCNYVRYVMSVWVLFRKSCSFVINPRHEGVSPGYPHLWGGGVTPAPAICQTSGPIVDLKSAFGSPGFNIFEYIAKCYFKVTIIVITIGVFGRVGYAANFRPWPCLL